MTTTFTPPRFIEDEVRAHLIEGPDASTWDPGEMPQESWTVWLLRHRPRSSIWVISLTPSPDLRAGGRLEWSTRAQLRDAVPFNAARFNSADLEGIRIDGEPLTDELGELISYLMELALLEQQQ